MLRRCSVFLRSIAICLVLSLVIPINANATTVESIEPRASYYLDSYQAYVYPAGSGEVQVWFNVTGDDYMDEIGALSIHIYESSDNSTWTYKTTYRHSAYPDMLGSNKIYHSGHVTYQGTAGKYYKAYVCIWAGKDGDGDTRYFWTSAKKAT